MNWSPRSHRRATALAVLAIVGGMALAIVTFMGSRAFIDRSLRAAPAPAASATVPPPEAATLPGSGILMGRLVDGVTGLPVADAGVTLLGANRRALSGPDGRFRFDGVPPGPVTVAFGPMEGYVPRTLATQPGPDGLDIGITPLLPVAPPTYLVPEYGGLVPGCGDTRLVFASMALAEPSVVSVTCIERTEEFPAAAPAGRLPLAVVDTAPGVLRTGAPAQLTVQLPGQPRFSPGVALDLLRLDLDRLTWRPAGQLTVDPGARTASGPVEALGTYLVVAPPFGQFQALDGDGAGINQLIISDRANGAPTDVFGPETPLVFVGFDFAGMVNTPIRVRTLDADNRIAHESQRPYTGDGRDNVPMVAPDGRRWPVGAYVTTLYVGEPPEAVGSGVAWRVAAQPTPQPVRPTVPPAPPILAGPWVPLPPPAARVGCAPPASWWARTVVPGDTLSGLAVRTGSTVAQLMGANCLASSDVFVGQVIYVPRPPAAPKPWPVGPPAGPPTYAVPAYPTPLPPVPSMPPPWPTDAPGLPGGPGSALPTSWKPTPEPGGWTPPPPPQAPPATPGTGRVAPPVAPPPLPTSPPAPPPAAQPTPVAKWTPGNRGEPTLAPRPTVGP